MDAPDARARFAVLAEREPVDDYNFAHFRTKHIVQDVRRTLTDRGIRPGDLAPDFALPDADGHLLRLSDLRGRPVLLHFGSYSWPATTGSVEPLRKLHARWGDRVAFVDVLIRQAHPGTGVPPYRTFAEKAADAVRYRDDEAIPWPVLVDDLAGAVHQVYGGLADPTYLIDADGCVAFYNMWTHAPTLHSALGMLSAQGDRGVVREGIAHAAHLGPPLTDGWRGLRRGLWQSVVDLETATPGAGIAIWAGSRLRPLVAPITLRSEPMPAPPVAAVAAGMGGLAVLGFAFGRRGATRR